MFISLGQTGLANRLPVFGGGNDAGGNGKASITTCDDSQCSLNLHELKRVQFRPWMALFRTIADEATLGQCVCVKVLGTANIRINGTVGGHTEAK